MTKRVCRVPGCVALSSERMPDRVSTKVLRAGLCGIHQQFSDDDLQRLLMREGGAVPRLRSIAAGLEYERADGSRHGYNRDGEHYEIIGGREVVGFHQ